MALVIFLPWQHAHLLTMLIVMSMAMIYPEACPDLRVIWAMRWEISTKRHKQIFFLKWKQHLEALLAQQLINVTPCNLVALLLFLLQLLQQDIISPNFYGKLSHIKYLILHQLFYYLAQNTVNGIVVNGGGRVTKLLQ